MKKTRASYIHDEKNKSSIVWQIMTLVSFLIILILIVLLVFSYLDSINNIIEAKQIEEKIENSKQEYLKSQNEIAIVNNDLLTYKEELQKLKETDGTKLVFFNEMKAMNNLRPDMSKRLFNSLNTRGILKNSNGNIFISKYNNVAFTYDYLFEDGGAIMKKQNDEMLKLFTKQLVSLLSTNAYAKYVRELKVEAHLPAGFTDEDSVLASSRAIAFKKALLASNDVLDKAYHNRVVCENVFDNKIAFDTNNDAGKNARIEFSIGFSEEILLNAIQTFINTPSSLEVPVANPAQGTKQVQANANKQTANASKAPNVNIKK